MPVSLREPLKVPGRRHDPYYYYDRRPEDLYFVDVEESPSRCAGRTGEKDPFPSIREATLRSRETVLSICRWSVHFPFSKANSLHPGPVLWRAPLLRVLRPNEDFRCSPLRPGRASAARFCLARHSVAGGILGELYWYSSLAVNGGQAHRGQLGLRPMLVESWNGNRLRQSAAGRPWNVEEMMTYQALYPYLIKKWPFVYKG
jgi:hypothetical protein